MIEIKIPTATLSEHPIEIDEIIEFGNNSCVSCLILTFPPGLCGQEYTDIENDV